MMVARVLRGMAILIAIIAVIDPAVTSTRMTRPEVAIIPGDSSRDAALAQRVSREIGERFTVIPALFTPAAATVLVGTRLPASVKEVRPSAFAIISAPPHPAAIIESVSAPARAALDARIPVAATVHVLGASGRDLVTTLHMGDAVIDRATQRIASGDERSTVSLSFVPTAIGAVPLRISARLTDPASGDQAPGNPASADPALADPASADPTSADPASAGPASAGPASTDRVSGNPAWGSPAPAGATSADPPGQATADLVIDIRDDRWAVLFFDPRPSWLSTFVRRSGERDPRFVVTSRVVTSRNVSIDAGRPPAALGDAESLARFDAIVVGAAQTLRDRDVAGLETFLRRRGGTVILLIDERSSGPIDRLAGVRRWNSIASAAGFTVSPVRGDSGGLRATSLVWPTALPPGAVVLASSQPAGAAGAERRPIIWRTAVGAGQVVASGALDAWRYRDPAQSRFDEFWRGTVADAAAAGALPIDIVLGSSVVGPGERNDVTATIRTLALAGPSAPPSISDSVAAAIETPSGSATTRLWPDGAPGRFRGSFRAPTAVGVHRLTVIGDGVRSDAPLLVSAAPARPTPNESDLVAAWVASRGGRVFNEGSLDELGRALDDVLRPTARSERWYPMRSAWWIVPFALLLGTEWLWRRRRGLA